MCYNNELSRIGVHEKGTKLRDDRWNRDEEMAIARKRMYAEVILRAPSTRVRFPRAIVRYRLPMSVVFSRLRSLQFLRVDGCALFSVHCLPYRMLSSIRCFHRALGSRTSLLLSFFLSFSFSLFQHAKQVEIVCIVRILPMILAIILNSMRKRESKNSGMKEIERTLFQRRQLGERYTSVRFVLNFTRCFRFPEHSLDIFTRLADKFRIRPAKSVEWYYTPTSSPDDYRSRRVSSFTLLQSN